MTADHAKAIADYFATMFDQEGANTVKVLRAVPNDRRDYKPDEKARTAWELATHIASSDIWFLNSVCAGEFTFDPDAENKMASSCQNIDDVVEFYQREFPKTIERLRAASGEQLAKEIDFFGAMKAPSVTFLGIANNHAIHHRAQLMTYLRSMGSKVPSIYGGSADEPSQGQ